MDFYTVDQFASILNMHPKTVRRYIHNGQLKAVKVGGEWRIRKEDVEMLMGRKVEVLRNQAIEDVTSYLKGSQSSTVGQYQVCTVIDCYVDSSRDAYQISEVIMAHMNEADPERGNAKFQYFYLEQEQKGRFVIWGIPGWVGKLLLAVDERIKSSS